MMEFLRVSHAGAGVHAPPNTLLALERALTFDVDMVEFDVRRCRDAIVLFHNPRLRDERVGQGRLQDFTLTELRSVDLGEDQYVPSLDEAVAFLRGRARMQIDIKETGYEPEVADVLRRHGVLGDALITSGSPSSLRSIGAAADVSLGLSYPPMNLGTSLLSRLVPGLMRLAVRHLIFRQMAAAQARVATVPYRAISRRLIDRAHHRRCQILAWTVDDLPTMRRLRGMGVDGIISNRPDFFAQM